MKRIITSILVCSSMMIQAQTLINVQSKSALNFNGSGDKIVVPTTTSTNITSGSWGAWVKFDGFNNTYQRIIYMGSKVELFYYKPLNRFEAEIALNGSRHEVVTDSSILNIQPNKWYHLMATYDTTVFKLYVDGILMDANTNAQGNIVDHSMDWGIGASATSGSWSFQGDIDEVNVWNVALTQPEIDELICMRITSSHPKYNNLVSYFPFEENSGTSVSDVVGGTTGTFTNSPTWVPYGMPYAVSSGMQPSICSGDSVQLIADGTNMPYWNTSLQDSSFVAPVATTSYVVSDTNLHGCYYFDTVVVTVNSLPQPVISATGTDLTCNIANASYQWYLDGVIIAGANSQFYTAVSNGAYSVEVVNGNGCVGISADYTINSVGVKESEQLKLTVYPNPSSGVVFIDCKDNVFGEVLNLQGEVVGKFSGTKANLAHLPDGMYILAFYGADGGNTYKYLSLNK